MRNSYFQANLAGINKVNVVCFLGVTYPHEPTFYVEKDGKDQKKAKILRHVANNSVNIYNLEMPENFEYGHSYVLNLEGLAKINIEVSEAVNFPTFDEEFYYDGDDLGAIYSKQETKFALWAPLSTSVILKIEENGEFTKYPLIRGDKGVYRITLKGDYLNKRYSYLVTNSGVTCETTDPWGKGASFNSEYSAVVDIEQIKKNKKIKPKTVIEKNRDAIIYETSIRDFTEDKNTNIVNKGKFLGMVEENRKTIGGHPAGLDYLKYLGITHLQILPVIDFYGNDDKDITKSYNWGYNPISFFAIEGSYSTKPELAMNRLEEFREMVDILHKNDIRVVMDVVYNHLYEFMYTCFEKVVPNYFYRRRPNGIIACASGCGDDFASERLMARRAIIDSLTYFTDVFDIDGFRFDLMGLIDVDTINQGFKQCRNIKKDVIFYGEGWNMGIELPMEKKACSDNADKMPGIGFFNDLYRDTLKGGNFRDTLYQKGYVGGNLDRLDIVNYVFKGSSIDIPFRHRFIDANQSLNYVECHDNNTLFDKLSASNGDEDISLILKRIVFANQFVLYSFGIPFIHMGQEIGLSKSGLDNTYNVLKINNMDWKLVDERFDMVESLVSFIKIRKELVGFFRRHGEFDINADLYTQYWENGILALICENKEDIKPYKKALILINGTTNNLTYELDDYFRLFTGLNYKKENKIMMKNGMIAPLSIQILYI